jgi:phospholipase C
MRPANLTLAGVVLAGLTAGLGGPAMADGASGTPATPIRHFVFLMQGDRSFDNYFGTYPKADGIPPDTCQALSLTRPGWGCVKPFSLHGAPPDPLAAGRSVLERQYHGGKMDGFVAAFSSQGRDGSMAMGHYDRRDLGFYWSVADNYVLFDRFFSSVRYGTRLNRSYWVSAAPPPGRAEKVPRGGYGSQPTIFDRLEAAGVSWKFYVQDYDPKETFHALSESDQASQTVRVPLLDYTRFVDDPLLRGHIADLDQYYVDLASGTLPSVAYVATAGAGERSARSIPAAQSLVRTMVTQLMVSQYWTSSAFMWSYDGSGGWYDHVAPPSKNTGFRVPALLVSAYARRGVVDHTVLQYPSALRFVEDNWGLKPLTTVDATATSIAGAFDFASPPRPPEILRTGGETALKPASVSVGAIYWYYGAGLLLAVGLMALTARPLQRERRPDEAAEPKTEVTV